ncbi:MAG: SGNH/GDSL hydrolase family protein [Alphaproteobacteria bacterium]|nr:SGNH/GDSL hydrolase family protein [Alphaproteobacteria bacterium]
MRAPVIAAFWFACSTASALAQSAAAGGPVHPVPVMGAATESVSPRCDVPADMLRLHHPMPHVAKRLAEGHTLTVVALGSSSTAGAGASNPALTYPARLEAELYAMFPHMAITVINRGVSGEEAANMYARIERDVIAAEPDLVIWQAGVNAAIKDSPIDQFAEIMSAGIDKIRAHGIDVMLMGPQNAPRYVNAPHRREYSDNLMLLSRTKEVPIFPRFRIMNHWQSTGQIVAKDAIAADKLHMTDASYYCIAQLLAHVIAEAAPHVPAIKATAAR